MKNNAKHLFFVAYGGAHIRMLLPVFTKLRQMGFRCTVLALTTAQPVMRGLGLDFTGFADLVEAGDEEAIEHGKKLAADLPTPPVDERETYAYLGLCYSDLETRLGKDEAARLYAEKGRQAFEPVTILTRVLKKFSPDMVVVTSSPRSEKAAAVAAGQLGITSVCLYDFFALAPTWAAQNGYTDKLLVFSDITKSSLVEQGRSLGDIIVTGNPAMDRLADPAWKKKAAQWRTNKGWDDKKIIFWASNPELPPDESLPSRIDAAVLAGLKRHPDWRLVMRFHPSEAVRLTEAGPNVYISPKQEELTPLLFACDACLIMTSTVGLEAAMIGKPVVTADMSANVYAAPFAQLGLSLGAKRLEDIDPCLAEALHKGDYQRPLLPPVGQATQAVTDIIIGML